MILKSICLENFRTYKGEVKIDIANDEKKITIIQGNNDAGKTTLMNAINWCLYGSENYNSKQKRYNSIVFKDATNNDIIPVKVILKMEDSDGNDVTITRIEKYIKLNNNECEEYEKDFKIVTNDGINDNFINIPNDYINTYLPKTLKDYFLFDGELLTQFFSKDNGNIKKDVFRLSQLNLIDNVCNHISTRKQEFISEKKNKEPEIGDILEGIDELEKQLEKDETNLNNSINDNKKYKDKLSILENKWENIGDDPYRLYEEIKNLESIQNKFEKEYNNEKINYKKFLFNNFSKIFSLPILKEIDTKCQKLKEEGYIPAQYKKSFLEFLLDNKMCICGRELKEGSEEYSKIEELFEKTDDITDISELINKLLGKVESLENNYPKNFDKMDNGYDDKLMDLEDKIDDIKDEIKEKKALIDSNITEEEISKLKNEIKYNRDLISRTDREIGRLEESIENAKKTLSKLNKEYESQKVNIGIVDDLTNKIDFCNKIYNTSKKLYDELILDIHNELQNLTTEEFNTYHWKSTYKSINIDDDFNVEFIKNDGTHVPATDPSAGTQLTLALSFITALNNLAGFELPIVIDTPLGRLDNDIRNNLGKFLPKYTKDKQVILLVTENEFSGNFKTNIIPYVGKKYKLNVINEGMIEFTKVIEW
ncbi:AAA family ATPase [Methanobrevibacter wolinii]|uniref:AAA family ATPase n=1 Tax=Methanobrevibacter wolinii TaxID=190977 RepID=UPI0005B28BA2|nr:AAA family ATPase [Methanobrevibacter wolinii]